jgi:hypothetical protein
MMSVITKLLHWRLERDEAGKPSAPICVLREGRKNPNIQASSAAIWGIPDYSPHRVKCEVELLLDEDQQKETIK